MIKFQAIPKFTAICYVLSIATIGFVMCEQFLEWGLLLKQTKITLLIVAAIIGVVGSIFSIGKQLKNHLKK